MKWYLILFVCLVQFEEWSNIFVTAISSINTDICESESAVTLTAHGFSAAKVILLETNSPKRNCVLNISAPKTYVVYMQIVELSAEIRELIGNRTYSNPPCFLEVFLPENKNVPIWKGDLCSSGVLPEVQLLTPEVTLVWNPPVYPSHTRGRRLVMTAIGQGEDCEKPNQRTCVKIGWKPILCISDHLLCDGNQNCPKGSLYSDEEETLCKSHLFTQSSWEQLAVKIWRKLKPPASDRYANNWIQTKLEETSTTVQIPHRPFINWNDLKRNEEMTTEIYKRAQKGNTTSTTFGHYGPWGYLMLGMLICGAVLMLCGLWECCFRKPKPPIEIRTQQSLQSSAVLVINSQDETRNIHQSVNEYMDEPPSYEVLFPNFKLSVTDRTFISDNRRVSTDSNANESVRPSSSCVDPSNAANRNAV